MSPYSLIAFLMTPVQLAGNPGADVHFNQVDLDSAGKYDPLTGQYAPGPDGFGFYQINCQLNASGLNNGQQVTLEAKAVGNFPTEFLLAATQEAGTLGLATVSVNGIIKIDELNPLVRITALKGSGIGSPVIGASGIKLCWLMLTKLD